MRKVKQKKIKKKKYKKICQSQKINVIVNPYLIELNEFRQSSLLPSLSLSAFNSIIYEN